MSKVLFVVLVALSFVLNNKAYAEDRSSQIAQAVAHDSNSLKQQRRQDLLEESRKLLAIAKRYKYCNSGLIQRVRINIKEAGMVLSSEGDEKLSALEREGYVEQINEYLVAAQSANDSKRSMYEEWAQNLMVKIRMSPNEMRNLLDRKQ